jgi:hypothetical protein
MDAWSVNDRERGCDIDRVAAIRRMDTPTPMCARFLVLHIVNSSQRTSLLSLCIEDEAFFFLDLFRSLAGQN